MSISRIICLILALIMVLSLAVSCGNDNDNESKTQSEANASQPDTASEPGSSEASLEETSEEESRVPLAHLDGLIEQYRSDLDEKKVITFLVENNNGSGYGSAEILPKEDTEIASYVKERNDAVESKLGIKIDERRTDNMITELRNAALSVPDFDIACPYMTSAGPLIQENLFYDLYEFDNIINFEGDYWDQNAENDLSMGGKLYMTTGDFSLLTLDVTHCMLFNTKIVKDKNLENPYELVKSKKWTMDKMYEMAKQVTADTDGEAGITYKDTLGLMINANYSNSLFIGAGESFCKKNASTGLPELTIYNPTSAGVESKIYEIFKDPKVLYIEGFNSQAQADGFTNCYYAARDALAQNRALFITISLSDVLALDDYDSPQFGMLVTPKYTLEQDRYYSYISIIYATCMVIPAGCETPELSALIMEALNDASTETVKHNYYERIFKLQKAKDDESEEMLDVIFDSRVYDIGALYNWGGIRDFISGIVTGNENTFASDYERIKDTINNAMSETINFFQN